MAVAGRGRRYRGTERLAFTGATGVQLVGVLHVPDTTPRGSVLFAHCLTCSKDPHTSTLPARSLTAAGYAMLRSMPLLGADLVSDRAVARRLAEIMIGWLDATPVSGLPVYRTSTV